MKQWKPSHQMGDCIFLGRGRVLHFSNPSQILRYPYQSVIYSPTIDSVIHYAGTIQTITIGMGMAANGWKTQANNDVLIPKRIDWSTNPRPPKLEMLAFDNLTMFGILLTTIGAITMNNHMFWPVFSYKSLLYFTIKCNVWFCLAYHGVSYFSIFSR